MILTVLSLALGVQQAALVCPAMGSALHGKPAEAFTYAGVTYGTCCAGCKDAFMKDPEKGLKALAEQGKVAGVFLYDPLSGVKLKKDDVKATSDFGGIRYSFTSEDEKKTFDADPKKYTKMPEKEALFCPVYKNELKDYAHTGGFVDYKGVRYYVCCADCLAKMKEKPQDFTANAESHVAKPEARLGQEDLFTIN